MTRAQPEEPPETDFASEGDEDLVVDAVEMTEDDADGEGGTARRGRRKRPKMPRRRLSDILREIVDQGDSSHITVGDLLRSMDGRAFGALLLIFAFPNVLPAPPGLAAFLGLPLLYLSAQMMLGRMPCADTAWQPAAGAGHLRGGAGDTRT